jgi:hypothetical protein
MKFVKRSKRMSIAFIVSLVSLLLLSTSSVKPVQNNQHLGKFAIAHSDSVVLPNIQQRVQRAGNINMCQTNWGFVGSMGRMIKESEGGCFNPYPDSEVSAPSFEFPKGSGLDYLFWGGLWVGAKVNDSIFVSTGCDGWQNNYEFFPGGPAPIDEIKEKSQISNPCYAPDAISDQDILVIYTDTIWYRGIEPHEIDPCEGRKHRPLPVKVIQNSHSWNDGEYGNFIMVKYVLQNIGKQILSNVYVGLFVDTDILHYTEQPYGSYGPQDDITGFLKEYEIVPGETQEVNIAWAADNDGWGYYDGELHWTLRHVIGLKILDMSYPEIQFSYNWWFSRMAGLPYDWGPWKIENQSGWLLENCYASEDSFFYGHALGTPCGDCAKYFVMSDGEIDYDQVYSCVWPSMHPEEGWLPANELCNNFADGYDTRFLLAFGPFDQMLPGDSIHFAVAYIIGENFHTDPNNGQNLPANPDSFYAHVDFSNLVHNAMTAQRLYDSLFSAPTEVEDFTETHPREFSLFQNYPNPFNPETKIKYTIRSRQAEPVFATLRIYNIVGQLVRTLVSEPQESGTYEVIWDGKDDKRNNVASGIYFYKLKAGEFSQTRKMVLIR